MSLTRAATDKGARTRKRIVGHATNLIYAKGYSNTSIQDVIDAAGVTKGSFYFHFDSKEELGYAVIENASDHILGKMRAALDLPGLTPAERLRSMMEEIRTIIEAADCSRGCILGNLTLEMSHLNEGFRIRLAEAFRSWVDLVADVLDEMKDSGDLPGDLDSREYAEYVISSVEGGIMMSKLTCSPGPMRYSMDNVVEQVRGLQSSGPVGNQ